MYSDSLGHDALHVLQPLLGVVGQRPLDVLVLRVQRHHHRPGRRQNVVLVVV